MKNYKKHKIAILIKVLQIICSGSCNACSLTILVVMSCYNYLQQLLFILLFITFYYRNIVIKVQYQLLLQSSNSYIKQYRTLYFRELKFSQIWRFKIIQEFFFHKYTKFANTLAFPRKIRDFIFVGVKIKFAIIKCPTVFYMLLQSIISIAQHKKILLLLYIFSKIFAKVFFLANQSRLFSNQKKKLIVCFCRCPFQILRFIFPSTIQTFPTNYQIQQKTYNTKKYATFFFGQKFIVILQYHKIKIVIVIQNCIIQHTILNIIWLDLNKSGTWTFPKSRSIKLYCIISMVFKQQQKIDFNNQHTFDFEIPHIPVQSPITQAKYFYKMSIFNTKLYVLQTIKILFRQNSWNTYQCILQQCSNKDFKNTFNTSIV
eukprot:TRINITY_DN1219_c0_g1_i11.p1 TRINITY_DN1219_c0_g1~~TRINITY_DN1219_c0_g1_i11.p1  ORF type:complete len:373 (+),score=-23.79 TRINITY_DN1219_c0_g1_i11:274-1392(+)